ncbi:MAG TPA: alpha/beta hydrolase [Pusillimonas sp.]|uniref:alpha/beta fold hydrolase n=1 Tax=unclassified Pusillimonas TaxID=2640016 RepID=UPI0026129E1E|nr:MULTISPECIES: alpha/beta hydrolase [unclassified Pusillimonas]HLU20378.1 alpha/beta hydrolase [Pusillimonas sp.]
MQTDTATPLRQTLEIAAADGVLIRARVYGPESATRLIVSHGNGLAAHGYASFWRPLTAEYQVVVLDFRGHGISDRGSLQNHSWNQLVEDFDLVMRAIRDELGQRATFGAFHSLSAVTSLLHAKRFGPILDGLALFDPPIIPPEGHPLQPAHIEEMMNLGRRVRRRRVEFDHWSELAEQIKRNVMYARCQPEACDEMARALLRQVSIEGRETWVLACDPEQEARIFESNDDTSLWFWLSEIDFPVRFICADPAVPGVQPSAPIGKELAAKFDLDYVRVPGTTHFLQLERPDLCTDQARAFCR